jgi:hypothetical protein
MQDVHISQIATWIETANVGIDREDAETLTTYAIRAAGVQLPAGAVQVTEGVASDAFDILQAGRLDPAAAAPLVMTRTEPEDREELTPAAIRDYCRRAAFDLGIQDRDATVEQLPQIADRVAGIIKAEAGAIRIDRLYVSKTQAPAYNPAGRPGHVAGMDVAAALPAGWVMDYNGRDFRHPSGASFALSQDEETVTIHFCRPVPSAVEIFHLDRPTTTAARVAGIITAALEAGK